MNIMVVDDQAQNRNLLRVILESYGHQVIEAKNGREALELIKSQPPDLILSDTLMPIMDGYALLYELGRDERLQKIPFIFYATNFIGEEDREFARKLGAAHFIRKPLDPEELIREIEKALENHRQRLTREQKEPISELEYYKGYSQRLVAKLEDKLTQVAQSNRLVRERNEELWRKNEENARLLEESQTALQLRDAFLNTAAHELKTPLATLKGWLQLSYMNGLK